LIKLSLGFEQRDANGTAISTVYGPRHCPIDIEWPMYGPVAAHVDTEIGDHGGGGALERDGRVTTMALCRLESGSLCRLLPPDFASSSEEFRRPTVPLIMYYILRCVLCDCTRVASGDSSSSCAPLRHCFLACSISSLLPNVLTCKLSLLFFKLLIQCYILSFNFDAHL
jgi:hypothetical protein